MNYGATSLDGEPLSSPPNPKQVVKRWMEVVMMSSIVLNGMGAGVMFIFSNTVMPALGKLSDEAGIEAMNTINTDIQNGWFFLVFFGGIVSIVVAANIWNKPTLYSTEARYYAVATTMACFLGPFLVTVTQNVPRNDTLLKFEDNPSSEEASEFWRNNFLTQWVAWNTTRTALQIVSAIFGILTLKSLYSTNSRAEATKGDFTEIA
jgi:uncharacterized membrane protein